MKNLFLIAITVVIGIALCASPARACSLTGGLSVSPAGVIVAPSSTVVSTGFAGSFATPFFTPGVVVGTPFFTSPPFVAVNPPTATATAPRRLAVVRRNFSVNARRVVVRRNGTVVLRR